jgi:hypothetical protein
MLARRVVPVVLALAVAFAPAAIEACQVACAIQAIQEVATSASGHEHHHAGADTMSRAHADTMAAAHAEPMARMASESTAAPARHSCHDPVPAAEADGAVVTAGPHACAHLDGLPVTAGAVAQTTLFPPAIATVLPGITPPIQATTAWATPAATHDSVPIALNLPLRV